jgi:hypothetical protein
LFDRVTNGDSKDSTNGPATTATTPSASSGGGFVFGQNLSDRVTNQQVTSEEEGNEDNESSEAGAAQTIFQVNCNFGFALFLAGL